MNVAHVKDINIVTGWQLGYGGSGKTKDAFLQGVEDSCKAKFAFAFIPVGDKRIDHYGSFTDEGDWLAEHKWEPVLWKESTHMKKYAMQLYRRTFDREPKDDGAQYFPAVGCSIWLHTFAEKAANFAKAFPAYPTVFGTAGKESMKFVTCVRPLSISLLKYFKKDPMWQLVAMTPWHQYWAWGYPGKADNSKCKY